MKRREFITLLGISAVLPIRSAPLLAQTPPLLSPSPLSLPLFSSFPPSPIHLVPATPLLSSPSPPLFAAGLPFAAHAQQKVPASASS